MYQALLDRLAYLEQQVSLALARSAGGGGGGSLTNITGTAPIVITTPILGVRNVAIAAATEVAAGSMSAADKTKLDALGSFATRLTPFSTSDAATPIAFGSYTIPAPLGPATSSCAMIDLFLMGSDDASPNLSSTSEFRFNISWDAVGGVQLNGQGFWYTNGPQPSAIVATPVGLTRVVNFTATGPSTDTYRWVPYLMAYTNP
jgi:hypothetical protein